MGFLKTILIVLLVYYALKIVMKWFGPRLLKYFATKMTEKVGKQFQQQYAQNSTQHKENNSTFNQKNTKQKSTKKPPVGEYIDFEEIE